MQLSLEESRTMAKLVITLDRDHVNDRMMLMVQALNRGGLTLASSSVVTNGWEEAELVQDLLADITLGWFWSDAKACTVEAMAKFRRARAVLRKLRVAGD